MSYPEHEKFNAHKQKLSDLQGFLEWLIEQQRSEHWPTTWADTRDYSVARRPKLISELEDREKERLLMRYLDIDYDAFQREKDDRVRELQEAAK